tara:strand:+ start:15822 stop:17747 length:1926 start_codon:yes stop_codon:yes gene_type:complete
MIINLKQKFILSLNVFFKLPLKVRRTILVLIDIFCILSAIFLSFLFTTTRLQETFYVYTLRYIWIFPITTINALIIFIISGQYKGLTRFFSSLDSYEIYGRNLILVSSVFLFGSILNFNLPHISLFVLIWFLASGFITFCRFGLKDIILKININKNKKCKPVAIYGAGEAGAQLCDALQRAQNHKVLFFLDDNPLLWGRSINGVKIYSPNKLFNSKNEIEQVLLAITSLSNSKRREILKNICKLQISVLKIPTLNVLAGNAGVDKLRSIKVEELLGRDTVLPCKELLGPGIYNSNICITGAGGSIGSELCKQILKLNPSQIIIIDHSEYALYKIEQQLKILINKSSISIISILGSCTDSNLINKLFKKYSITTVFHAAAYKHVPLVESNPISGLMNNVISTKIICEASLKNNVKKFILISTDKAVRPTNIMGASKRLSELIVQGYAYDNSLPNIKSSNLTLFSMVRFGNVLRSSGSVVPQFEKQIAEGGPITLTDKRVVRYFMTIEEAVQLVLQTSELSIGGDVFLLDMGEPILIKDLAMQMINLSGLTIKDKNNPRGDIEIICTGLRPGEKLYEELLIGDKSIPTKHPYIYRAQETFINKKELWPILDELELVMRMKDEEKALKILKRLIPEWTTNIKSN